MKTVGLIVKKTPAKDTNKDKKTLAKDTNKDKKTPAKDDANAAKKD